MHKKLSANSPWNYFKRAADGKSGVCTVGNCTAVILAKGGSTSGLHGHLRSKHSINLLKRPDAVETSSSTSTSIVKTPARKITAYFVKPVDESFEAIVSRMVALDGLPFKKFITSVDLKLLLAAKGYNVPKSAQTIRDIVVKFAENIKAGVMVELAQQVSQGKKFSLTFDEWTSLRNRRYMNINVHEGVHFYNLGLSRVFGSMPAEKTVKLWN